MKQTRVIIIDSEKREVREGTVSSLEDCQKLVGGLIERAGYLITNDEVFVNEEGLMGQPKHFFMFQGGHSPVAGNGYITGPTDSKGNETDCTLSLEQAYRKIKFLDINTVALVAQLRGDSEE